MPASVDLGMEIWAVWGMVGIPSPSVVRDDAPDRKERYAQAFTDQSIDGYSRAQILELEMVLERPRSGTTLLVRPLIIKV